VLARVLVVSADRAWTTFVAELLSRETYDVVECTLGGRALERTRTTGPNLVVLDLAIPDRHGLTLCSLLRAANSLPIIAAGDGTNEYQLERSLAAGADVFVPKHITDRELLARVRALLRRVPSTPAPSESQIVRVGGVELDRGARTLRVDGRLVIIARREFDVLELLMMRAGRVVSRSDLLDVMWGTRRDPHALSVHIHRLRAKLELFDTIRRIETVRGVGFRFVVEPDPSDDPIMLDLNTVDIDSDEAGDDPALVV
jgi:two-component system response regulator RegX3